MNFLNFNAPKNPKFILIKKETTQMEIIEKNYQVMNDYAEKAKGLLASFPDSDVKQALIAYVDYVIDRTL